jgi:nucleotide-binding universal stress UspA family protein
MPKTIIVPLDGSSHSERALEPARMISQQSAAHLVLVTSRLGGVLEPQTYLESVARDVATSSVRTVVFEDRLAVGSIMTVAGTEPDPVVCMATHARRGAGLAVFGSITEEVIRRIDVPLVLVGPSVVATPGASRFEEMVVCLDGSPAAAGILPTATDWVGNLGLRMWLVDVVDPDSLVDAVRTPGADVSAAGPLERVARELSGSDVNVSWETLSGRDPASAIVAFAQERSSPLIAMTTHGRSGLARVAAGSVTMAVVHHAPCPVLVTRSRHLSRA